LGDKLSVTLIATGFERKIGVSRRDEPGKKVVSLDEDTVRQTQKETIEFKEQVTLDAHTVEFNDVKETIKSLSQKQYTYTQPYLKEEESIEKQRERAARVEKENRRREKLREVTVKLNKQTIVDLENEPAYIRRRVELDSVFDEEEPGVSRWTIGGDEEPVLKQENSFLHDNVD
jgi:cell division protein FtsZ